MVASFQKLLHIQTKPFIRIVSQDKSRPIKIYSKYSYFSRRIYSQWHRRHSRCYYFDFVAAVVAVAVASPPRSVVSNWWRVRWAGEKRRPGSGDIRWWGDQGASPEASPATWHNNNVTRGDKKVGYIVSSFAPLVGGLIYIRKHLSQTRSRLELKSLEHWCKDVCVYSPNNS